MDLGKGYEQWGWELVIIEEESTVVFCLEVDFDFNTSCNKQFISTSKQN